MEYLKNKLKRRDNILKIMNHWILKQIFDFDFIFDNFQNRLKKELFN
jgi:hypothetical protein